MAGIQFPQFNEWEPTLDGLEGNFQAEPRVFVHDAVNVVLGNVSSLKSLNGGAANSNFVDGATMATTSSATGAGLTLKISADGGIIKGVEIINRGGSVIPTTAANAAYVIGEVITIASPGAGPDATMVVNSIDIPNTQKRGCCLYVGVGADVGVTLESGNSVVFKGVIAGTFLPVLAKSVNTTIPTTGDIIALYQSMWFGIGYTVPQKADTAGEPRPPSEEYLMITQDAAFEMQTEDGAFTMELQLTTG